MEDRRKTWGVLVGSKRRLRKILTGEESPPPNNLAEDMLYGAQAVADFTGLNERQVYHKQKALGLTRLGSPREAS
jgi:hypothetical protein